MFQVYCNYVHVDTLVFHLYQYMYCTFGKNMEKPLHEQVRRRATNDFTQAYNYLHG